MDKLRPKSLSNSFSVNQNWGRKVSEDSDSRYLTFPSMVPLFQWELQIATLVKQIDLLQYLDILETATILYPQPN